jgi:hypothetical protein
VLHRNKKKARERLAGFFDANGVRSAAQAVARAALRAEIVRKIRLNMVCPRFREGTMPSSISAI